MRLLTLADARASRIPQVLDLCGDSDQFTSYINEAIDRLIIRGNWIGTYQPINLCVNNGCLTFPREVAAIGKVALCSEPVHIRNQWYEFLSYGDGLRSGNECNLGCPGRQFIDRGFYPAFDDIIAGNKIIRFYPSDASDVGKRILVQGYDSNNQWIRTLDGTTPIDGFYMTLAMPFVDSTFEINSITGIQKPLTNFNVSLFEVNSVTGSMRALGVYQPSETNPSYRRYFMTNFSGNECGCDGTTTKSIRGIAKLEFIPATAATDWLYISNLAAIKEMCQSIRYAEADTSESKLKADIHEKRAIKELNRQKENYNGDDTIAVSMRVFGSADLRRKNIGRLT